MNGKAGYKKIFDAGVILLMSAGVVCLSSCRNNPEHANKEEELTKAREVYLTPVVSESVEFGTVETTLPATGSLVALRSSIVKAEEAGRLEFANQWKEGDFVEEDTVIAKIDSPELLRELELNKRDVSLQEENMNIGKRTLDAKRRDYETLQNLYSQGISAEREVDAAKLELDRAENAQKQNVINYEKAKVRLIEVEERQKELEIKAPYDGYLVSVSTLRGQADFDKGFGSENITEYDGRYIGTSFEICGIYDKSSFVMRCQVTPRDISDVEIGQKASIQMFTRDELKSEGEVVAISKSVKQDTRAFDVDISIDSNLPGLTPGLFGKAQIVTKQKTDTIVIPREALTQREDQMVIFAVNRESDFKYPVAKEVSVEPGLESDTVVEILSGLEIGDEIITRGYEVIQDGTPIQTSSELAGDQQTTDIPLELEPETDEEAS